jgi:maltose alpha-D-glucosyltransferase/alpha-amylase
LLQAKNKVLSRFQPLLGKRIVCQRIRVHGSYHLGKLLYTGKDFVIADFQGEPFRSVSERTVKRSGLRDIASMLRSMHYAAHSALLKQVDRGVARREDLSRLEAWADLWYEWVAAAFVESWGRIAAVFYPSRKLQVLLDAELLETCDELVFSWTIVWVGADSATRTVAILWNKEQDRNLPRLA